MYIHNVSQPHHTRPHHTLAEHRTGCARLKPFKSVILAFLEQPPASTFYFIISSDGSSFRLLHIAGPQNNHNAKSSWIIRTFFSNHQVLRWPTRATLSSSLPPPSSSSTSLSPSSSSTSSSTWVAWWDYVWSLTGQLLTVIISIKSIIIMITLESSPYRQYVFHLVRQGFACVGFVHSNREQMVVSFHWRICWSW